MLRLVGLRCVGAMLTLKAFLAAGCNVILPSCAGLLLRQWAGDAHALEDAALAHALARVATARLVQRQR